MATKTATFTAKQTAVLESISGGAGTDAEIGETMPTTKLSAIASVTRSLINKGVILRDEAGRYAFRVAEVEVPEVEVPEVEEEVTTAPVDLSDDTDEAVPADQDDAPEAVEEPAPGTQVFTDDQNAGWAKALEIQATGRSATLEFTKPGYAKSFTIGTTAYLTRNGQYLAAKGTLDSQPKAPWALYAITEEGMTLLGTYPTVTRAFHAETIA